jgi:hypothetical protein
MKKTITTRLGDVWTTDHDHVKCQATGRHYFLSDSFIRMLTVADAEQTRENEPAFAQLQDRMAARLREIQTAPSTPDKKCFLIADRELEGWSHPVYFSNPVFDWNERAAKEGTLYVLTEDPAIAIQSVVGDPELSKNGLDEGYSAFNVMHFDYADEHTYRIVHTEPYFEEAEKVAKGKCDTAPLPSLSYESVAYMFFPQADSIGMPGLCAELQLCSENHGGFRHQYCQIHILDRFDQCLASSVHTLDDVFNIRDGFWDVKDYIDQYKHEDVDKVLHKFKHSEVCEPESLEEMVEVLDNLQPDKFLKFHTADEEFQIMLSYTLVETFRTLDGKRVHTGRGIPELDVLQKLNERELVKGQEQSYSLIVKRTDGAMTKKIANITLSASKLFELISNDDAPLNFIEDAKERSPRFAENIENGDPPCEHQLIAAACQGNFSDIRYTMKNSISVQKLIQQHSKVKSNDLAMG